MMILAFGIRLVYQRQYCYEKLPSFMNIDQYLYRIEKSTRGLSVVFSTLWIINLIYLKNKTYCNCIFLYADHNLMNFQKPCTRQIFNQESRCGDCVRLNQVLGWRAWRDFLGPSGIGTGVKALDYRCGDAYIYIDKCNFYELCRDHRLGVPMSKEIESGV